MSLSLLSLFNILCFILSIKGWNNQYRWFTKGYIIRKKTNYMLLCILLFCVFAGWDFDYLHYEEIFNMIIHDSEFMLTSHIEPIYAYIINTLCFNSYTIFRLIIWGGALFILTLILKKIKIYNDITLSIFLVFNLLFFSYTRATLGFVIFFYGFISLNMCTGYRQKFLYSSIILLSALFHKSCIILILLSILSNIKLSKSRIIILISFIPVFVYFIKNYLINYLLSIELENDYSNISSSVNYLNKQSQMGIIGVCLLVYEKIIYLSVFFHCCKKILSNKTNIKYLGINKLFTLLFYNFYLYLILLLSNIGYIIPRRVELISYLPLFIIFSLLISTNINYKLYKKVFIYSFIYTILKLLYSYYCQL